MTTSIPDVLAHSAEEVLETMFFTQVIGRRTLLDEAAPEKPFLAVRLCFLGGLKTDGDISSLINPGAAQPGGRWTLRSRAKGPSGSHPAFSQPTTVPFRSTAWPT